MSNSVVGGAEEQEKDELYEKNDDDTARRGTGLPTHYHERRKRKLLPMVAMESLKPLL